MKGFFQKLKNIPWKSVWREHRMWFLSAGLFVTGRVATAVFSLPALVQFCWMAVAGVFLLADVISEAIGEWQNKRVGEHTLLLIAVVAAFVIEEWFDGVLVLLLFSLGEWVEDVATDRSRDEIKALAATTPHTAFRIGKNKTVEEIPVGDIKVGDVLSVPPHALVPVDCRVSAGHSFVNTAALTGESVPVEVVPDSELLSGTVNGEQELTVVAVRETDQSAAARILRLVEDALDRKGKSERFITRFAGIYTPVVTAMAFLLAVVVPLIFGGWDTWIYRGLVFLVASCPCALVISIPLSFYAGIAAAAHKGVLIKGGCFVESLSRVNAIAFDKTGTLTEDTFEVTKITVANGVSSEDALRWAASLERYSHHPLARAILTRAGDQKLNTVRDRREEAGMGVFGTIKGCEFACGGKKLLDAKGISRGKLPSSEIYLIRDGEAVAAFSLRSPLRPGAKQAVEQLRNLSVGHIALLSGDRKQAVDSVAKSVGITEVRGDMMPQDKSQYLWRWKTSQSLVTAFVGDGINDAPVLAEADVGIAMGFGSQAAVEIADVVLVGGELNRLPDAIAVCRRVMKIVRGNMAFALAVKALVLVLAVVGLAPIWLGVFADMGVTLLCVLNTLRLLALREQ